MHWDRVNPREVQRLCLAWVSQQIVRSFIPSFMEGLSLLLWSWDWSCFCSSFHLFWLIFKGQSHLETLLSKDVSLKQYLETLASLQLYILSFFFLVTPTYWATCMSQESQPGRAGWSNHEYLPADSALPPLLAALCVLLPAAPAARGRVWDYCQYCQWKKTPFS